MQSFQDTPFIIENKKSRKSARSGGRRGGLIVFLLLFFGAIAVGIVVFFSFGKNTFTVKGRTLYAVRLFASEVEAEATERAAAVKAAGGSGYVYNDGTYSVLAAIYANEKDAQTVADRNAGQIVTLTLPKFKCKMYQDGATSQTVSDCARYAFTTLFDDLYKISVDLDAHVLSESAAAYQVADCKNALLDVGQSLDALLVRFPSDATLLKIKNAYLDAAAFVEKVSEGDGSLAARIKWAACAVTVRFKQLLDGLA